MAIIKCLLPKVYNTKKYDYFQVINNHARICKYIQQQNKFLINNKKKLFYVKLFERIDFLFKNAI